MSISNSQIDNKNHKSDTQHPYKDIEDAIQKAIDTEVAKTQESDIRKLKKAQSR
jgi:hypothetical protein